MSIYQHSRVVALRKKQSREAAELYDQFLRLHPDLDGYVNHDDWTPEENLAFREFTSMVSQRHKEEQRALVDEPAQQVSPRTVEDALDQVAEQSPRDVLV